jgi:thiamine kinase-like enzyme
MDSLIAAVQRSFRGWDLSDLRLLPLPGGITNRNYTFDYRGITYVVREPGERTGLLGIDRAHEAQAAHRAAQLELGPPIAAVLDGVGTLITELVDGVHLDGAAFIDRLPEVVELVLRFHGSGSLGGDFPIHRVVEWHANDAVAHGVPLPSTWELLHDVSQQIEEAFAASPEELVPSHNDLLPGNLLFSPSRTWLLDYEYAGMNDRYFDLGNLSVNSGFDADADAELLRCYFGTVTDRSSARLQLMKIMSEFREGMWAVVQQAISTLDTDFKSYADERLSHCVHLATSHRVEDLLSAAAEPD